MRLGLQFQRCMDSEAEANRTGKTTTKIDLSVRDALTGQHTAVRKRWGWRKRSARLPKVKSGYYYRFPERSLRTVQLSGGLSGSADHIIRCGYGDYQRRCEKRFGKLTQQNTDKIRSDATEALRRIQKAAKKLPKQTAEEVATFFDAAQEQARENFSAGYSYKNN